MQPGTSANGAKYMIGYDFPYLLEDYVRRMAE